MHFSTLNPSFFSNFSRTLRNVGSSLTEGKVWLYLLLPTFLTLLVWLILFVFFLDALIRLMMESAPFAHVSAWGWLWLAKFLAMVSAWISITSLAYLCSLCFTALFVLPFLLKHLIRRHYPHLIAAGNTPFYQTFLYSCGILLLFIIGSIVSLPLWFVPGMALILPILLMAWFNDKTYTFDILSELATAEEKKEIRKIHAQPLFFLGLFMALLAHLPFLTLLIPGLSALFFSHYLLAALSDLRRGALFSTRAQP